MKKISKFIMIILSLFILTGCGSFFGGETATGIANIEKKELEDGSIELTITYNDEEVDPVVITIPKGQDGLRGNGIKDIYPEIGTNSTKIIITYTDTSVPQDEIEIPHGAEIQEILVVDAEGNVIEDEDYIGAKFIKIIYTSKDPENPEKNKEALFELPKGEKGNGIETVYAGKLNEDGTIDETAKNDDGSVTLGIKYTDSEELQILTIPASKSILKVTADDNGSQYKISIQYNVIDPTTGEYLIENHFFAKPKITQWLYGKESPKDWMGNVGDYYFDTDLKILYFKIEVEGNPMGHWDEIVNLGIQSQVCHVTFDLNGGFFEIVNEEEVIRTYDNKIVEIQKGQYFYGNPNVKIPVPKRDGYTFMGWYTSSTVDQITGKFTDLTVVATDITLFAIWQENN